MPRRAQLIVKFKALNRNNTEIVASFDLYEDQVVIGRGNFYPQSEGGTTDIDIKSIARKSGNRIEIAQWQSITDTISANQVRLFWKQGTNKYEARKAGKASTFLKLGRTEQPFSVVELGDGDTIILTKNKVLHFTIKYY